jgi:hypothetical protein
MFTKQEFIEKMIDADISFINEFLGYNAEYLSNSELEDAITEMYEEWPEEELKSLWKDIKVKGNILR